ncbi:MAG: hypothetical protein Q8N91_02325 [Candidatus Omnitrophota bacterium]|nr:hypothetical protein [Candidatus Omnitrophota bacterium]
MIKMVNKLKFLPVLITCLVIFTIASIPFKIIESRYMPGDDALRHAAKAVSGKDWNQILVLRDDVKIDIHAGWHSVLGFVHKTLDFNAYQLVLFSVFILFLLFSLVPILLLERPEAWVFALLAISVADPLILKRLLLGRPYLVTMAAIAALGCLWPFLAGKRIRYANFIMLAVLTAIATWIHGGWYFFLLPIAAIFMARQWRAGLLAALATAAGVIAGASLTGHPVMFFAQTLKHVFLSFGNCKSQGMLVTEFQPFIGDFSIVIVVIFMLMWRALRGDWDRKTLDNPVAILALTSWALGFITKRVWLDIGLVAVLIWMASEFQEFFISRMPLLSWKRVLTTGALSAILFAATTNDAANRWSSSRPTCLTFAEDASWAPGRGGIVYSNSMEIFYGMFYKNPAAPWRYILGFEPGIMPPEDLEIYRKIQQKGEPSSFAPWVKKMRPEDRLIIVHLSDKAPKIEGLEWYDAGAYIWIGRLPVKG